MLPSSVGRAMDIEIRTITDDEFPQYLRAAETAFSYQPRDEEIAVERNVAEIDRSLVAMDAGQMVGSASAYSLELTIPAGRTMPMAGITMVGVIPTHRRRGVLTALMRRQLDDLRDSGEVVAGLFASEGSIYGRFGYGLATMSGSLEIERDRAAFARPVHTTGQITLVDRDRALEAMPGVYERIRPGQPGMLGRTAAWWSYLFTDLEHWRDGASPYFFAVHRAAGEVDGYVVYRVKHEWEVVPRSELQVREIIAGNPEAYAELWRFCLDIDLIGTIRAWGRPAHEPLLYLLAEPRRLRLRVGDALWLRALDLPKMLEARPYAQSGRIVLGVRDAFCPWNEGRFELEAGSDGARCRPTKAEPDLVLDVAALGAAYLGGARFATLAWAGGVAESTPGALARADSMFRSDPPPWCSHTF